MKPITRPFFVVLLLAACLTFPLVGQTSRAVEPRSLAFTHVNVIDMTGTPVQTDMTVVITGDKISAVGKTAKTRVPRNARVVDAKGKFLIPGLWDMHVHWNDQRFLPLFIANGVTGVRQMFGQPEHLAWRHRLASGELLGPRQYLASPIVDGPNPVWPGSIKVANADEARQAVRQIKADGYDFVKIYNGISRESYFAIADEAKKQGLSFAGHLPNTVTAAEASAAGQKSIEHLNNLALNCTANTAERREARKEFIKPAATEEEDRRLDALWLAWERATIAAYDPATAATLFGTFAKNQTWQCPTLTVNRAIAYVNDPAFRNDPRLKYLPKTIRENWLPENDFRFSSATEAKWAWWRESYALSLRMVRDMRAAGVPILAGTDVLNPFCFPGFSLHDELGLLVQAGLTPMEALQAATINPARFLGTTDSLGTVQAGKIADLLLLDANPLDNIANTKRIAAVLVNGRYFDRSELDGMLANAERIANLKSIGATLWTTIETQDVAAAVRQYREIRTKEADAYELAEGELNSLGYKLLRAKKTQAAVEIFKLNAEMFPDSWNAYDSLADGYLANGDKELAIQNYRRSLELNPGNANALEQLKLLAPK